MPRANTLFIGSLAAGRRLEGQAQDRRPANHRCRGVPSAAAMDRFGRRDDGRRDSAGVPPAGSVLVDSDAGPMLAVAPRESFEDVVMGFVLVDEQPAPGAKRSDLSAPTGPFVVQFLLVRPQFAELFGRPRADGRVRPRCDPAAAVTLRIARSRRRRSASARPAGRTVSLPPAGSGR